MRRVVGALGIVVAIGIAGCGAAPDAEEGTTPAASGALQPLEIAQPQAQLRGVDGANATFDISVVVTNANPVEVIMRRMEGQLFLDGQQAARIEVEGADPIDADSERAFLFTVQVPLAMIATLQGDEYVARGTLYADGGSGDSALQTPFELTGPVPR
ncbi:MAG: LEA type 2 family protein [Myxococcota bacterium]|nr:LEA type 2 family protein [Myxococcota bacterium]